MQTAGIPRSVRSRPRTGGYGRYRLFLACLCALLLVSCASQAASPASQGRSTPVARFDRGLLWKIEVPGERPSYLFGTIHADDPRVTALPAPVSRALSGADRFVMEALLDGTAMEEMAKAMYFDDGRTLEQIAGRDLYAATLKALSARGVPAADVEKQKPWAAVMALSLPPPTSGQFLDLVLATRSAQQGKPIAGLETMQEQIAVFDDMPMADQVALLRETVRHLPQLDKDMQELIQAYLARDLRRIAQIGGKHEPGEEQLYRRIMGRLLTQRNARMAQRLMPFLKQGNSFIAVGAAHLAGDDGLLQLLENAGYRVTPIY
jgi:uncharacterized protein YbaP (TraB family)